MSSNVGRTQVFENPVIFNAGVTFNVPPIQGPAAFEFKWDAVNSRILARDNLDAAYVDFAAKNIYAGVDGTNLAPTFSWISEVGLGFYRAAAATIGVAGLLACGAVSGTTFTATTKFLAPDGLVSAPGYGFTSATNTGLFRDTGTGRIVAAVAGNQVFGGTANFLVLGAAGNLSWTSSDVLAAGDLLLARDAANILAQRNGVNSQAFRLYNTYTDASNYERATFSWASSLLTMGTESAGTGVNRDFRLISGGTESMRWTSGVIQVKQAMQFAADNTLDIGTAGALRPRSIYAGTSFLAPDGTLAAPGLALASSTNTGLYNAGGGVLGLSQGNTDVMSFVSTNIRLSSGILFGWASGASASTSLDTILVRDAAANTLAQRNGVNAQKSRIYNTFTDASNGEWYETDWITTANSCAIGTNKNGSGVTRGLIVKVGGSNVWSWGTASYVPIADVTQDIGDATHFVKDLYYRRRITKIAVITYSASMTPDASLGDMQLITITNGTAFTINAPTNPLTGQEMELMLKNTSGGAAGVATFNAIFKMVAWVQPATGFSRSIYFRYDGTNWVEVGRTAADVPN